MLPKTRDINRFPKTVTMKNVLSPRILCTPRVTQRRTCIGVEIVNGLFFDLEHVSITSRDIHADIQLLT
jgi:hypothetical protein